jgi:hypothetical protein
MAYLAAPLGLPRPSSGWPLRWPRRDCRTSAGCLWVGGAVSSYTILNAVLYKQLVQSIIPRERIQY